MCDATALLMMGVMQAGGQISAGRAAKAAGYAAADAAEYEGSMARKDAATEAANVRRAGRRQVGQTLADITASGVKVGEGSALEAERYVVESAARDEYAALITGERAAGAAEREAIGQRAAGRSARRAANMQAATTLLASGYNYGRASGWRANGPGFSGNQAPAPVSDRSVWSSGGNRYVYPGSY